MKNSKNNIAIFAKNITKLLKRFFKKIEHKSWKETTKNPEVQKWDPSMIGRETPAIMNNIKNPLTIDNKKYIYSISDQNKYEIEDVSTNRELIVDGWVIQYRWNTDKNPKWYGHWNNKIYRTKEISIMALTNISKSNVTTYNGGNKLIFRIKPIYTVNQSYFRDILISELLDSKLSDKKEKLDIEKFEAFKAIENTKINPSWNPKATIKIKKDDIILKLNNLQKDVIKLSTPTESGHNWYSGIYKELMKQNPDKFKKVNLMDEKWIHPHLTKKLKLRYNIKGNFKKEKSNENKNYNSIVKLNEN